MASDIVKVGIVGCGNISGIYFENCGKVFENTKVAACADIDMEKARAKAAENSGVKACTVEQLLADPEIEIVVNLTVPKAHGVVAQQAVEAGKSVHNEKPLTVTRDEGKKLLETAKQKKVLVGSAPDTFMGGGIQTCRKLIDDGWIGQPVAATAFMLCPGHESWHPSPEFYYEVGGGPMFDMGPYYLTALINLLGPVRRVCAATKITHAERLITSQPKFGKVVKVDTPTHIAGVLDFTNGAIGTIVTSFDVWGGAVPCIEIYGTQGTISVPDPNGFGGPVRVRRPREDWAAMPLTHGYADNMRGIGVADMACALRSKRAHRANGQLAYHVLDTMQSFLDSSAAGKHVDLASTCQQPAPMPMGLRKGVLDP